MPKKIKKEKDYDFGFQECIPYISRYKNKNLNPKNNLKSQIHKLKISSQKIYFHKQKKRRSCCRWTQKYTHI